MIKKVFTTQHSTICIVWLIADKFEYNNPNDKKQKKLREKGKLDEEQQKLSEEI